MKKTVGKWYHYKSVSSEFYSPSAISIKKYFFVGEGTHKPTPKESFDLIESIKKENKNITYGPEIISEGLYYINQVDEFKEIELPSGTYQYVESGYDTPDRLVPVKFRNDSFVKIGEQYDAVLEDIKTFLNKEHIYRELDILYKRGLLLYGPPGQGKTALIRMIVNSELPEDAVVIMFDKNIPDVDFLNSMKTSLQKRTKLFIFEELSDFIAGDKVEDLLTFLDGEFSIDKSLIIATTNYPEKLPGNLVDRPSRFDKLYKISNPNAKQRKMILEYYLKTEPTKSQVDVTDKLSTAGIKEVVLLSKLRDITIEEAASLVRKHSETVKKNFAEDKERIGL